MDDTELDRELQSTIAAIIGVIGLAAIAYVLWRVFTQS